jgi:hypothetical protein
MGSCAGSRLQFPNQRAPGAFAADQANLLFQSARPFRAGAVIGEGEFFPHFMPGGSLAFAFEVLLDGGFEYEVLHERRRTAGRPECG